MVASISGTVVERKVTRGQVVQPADELFTVADLSRVWVVGEVPEIALRDLVSRVVDAGTDAEGGPFLVTPLVAGEPIDVWCREHQADISTRLNLLRQVVAALVHAHHHLIVHRDLKPSNVLVTPDAEVKLLDFGIAQLTGQADPHLTQPSMTIGTAAYICSYACWNSDRWSAPRCPASTTKNRSTASIKTPFD